VERKHWQKKSTLDMANPNERPLEQNFGILSPSCQISSNIQYISGLISHYNDLHQNETEIFIRTLVLYT
jgi:hypothetical protein